MPGLGKVQDPGVRRHGDNTGAQQGSDLASDQNNVRLSYVPTTSEARLWGELFDRLMTEL